MPTCKFHDGANEYRIEIVGKFAGPAVHEIASSWKKALKSNLSRKVTVDISRLNGYDNSGLMLLREMHKHGTMIAASTSDSLVFLAEITSTRWGPAVLHETSSAKAQPLTTSLKTKSVASGE